jgi:hypothetical protein
MNYVVPPGTGLTQCPPGFVGICLDTEQRLFEILVAPRQSLRRTTGFVILALIRDSTHRIEHVEPRRKMTQQMSQIPESLGVL